MRELRKWLARKLDPTPAVTVRIGEDEIQNIVDRVTVDVEKGWVDFHNDVLRDAKP